MSKPSSAACSSACSPSAHGDDLVALAGERPLEQRAQLGLVVDDQDLQRRGHVRVHARKRAPCGAAGRSR